MNSVTTLEIASSSPSDTLRIAGMVGRKLTAGEVIELVGDLGSGKTVFVRGLAKAIGSRDVVQSPTFTVERVYRGKQLTIHHFDFHRLDKPGVVANELTEVLKNPKSVVVVEWSDIVESVLPQSRLRVEIKTGADEDQRVINFKADDVRHRRLVESRE